MIHMFNQHIICNNIIYCPHFQIPIYIKIPQEHEAPELSVHCICNYNPTLIVQMHILLSSEKATTNKSMSVTLYIS